MRLAVVDIRMPGMSGIEVLAGLRVVSPRVRVIIMTGENDPALEAEALAGGASAFFLKPFNDEVFLQAVRDALALST